MYFKTGVPQQFLLLLKLKIIGCKTPEIIKTISYVRQT